MVKAALAIVLAVALPCSAYAGSARDEFQAGREHFSAGRYAEALPHLERAYALSNKRPSTIQALAQCHRAMEHLDQAIAFFEEFLQTNPKDADRVSVEKTIELLQQKRRDTTVMKPASSAPETKAPDPFDLATRPTSAEPPVVATAPPPASPPSEGSILTSPWLWIAIGVVAVGAVSVGVVLSGGEAEPIGGSLGETLRL